MNKPEMKNLMKAPFSEIIKAIKDKFVTRMKGQRHPKIVIKFTEKEVQAIQEALDTPELREKESRSPLRRAYAEMSQALSIYQGEQRSIPETDDDAGDEY